MNYGEILKQIESDYLKKDVPKFNVGDTIRLKVKIAEGDKSREQPFEGTVIAKKGKGLSETFTLSRIAYGSRVERVFLLHSPSVSGISVVRAGKVRRAKLYYLRGRMGKSAKVKELYVSSQASTSASS